MREIKKLHDVENVDELLSYLCAKGMNHNSYYHYTTWDSFSKIYDSKLFLLTRGNSLRMNDQHEPLAKGDRKEWNRIYVGSFSYGKTENMAMWGLYGQPAQDAVRIEIPRDAMNRWISSVKQVYLWDGQVVGPIDAGITLTDIVYVSGESGSSKLQLTHRDRTMWTTDKPDLYGVDVDRKMTGYIKNYAWHYENEVRLRVELPESTGMEKIAIEIPDEVLNSMKIMKGPSFKYKKDNIYDLMRREGRVEESGFENLLNYRTLCDICGHGGFVKSAGV